MKLGLVPTLVALGVLTAAQLPAAPVSSKASRSDSPRFNEEIRPILSENCFKCHGPDEAARKARLRLDVRDEALKPAKSGQLPIVPRSPEKSELIARITTSDLDDRMPPAKTGKVLTPAQIELLKRWIAEGAPYATHWAYVKPTRPVPPSVRKKNWAKNAIDYFILARLEREGLFPSAPAERTLLIRRAALDLTGLPPTLEEVEEFVRDQSADAYEKVIDRLLAKPAFGEHWARLWLDLARYADSAGYADDPPRTIWAYRDYVIRAFNANKPFDRFTIEQIAGDLLDGADEDCLIATAFHRNTMTNNEGGTNDEEFRNAAVVDRANTTMAVWMATSLACAECHHHKYDPISNQEYFRFFAFFNNTQDADLKDESPLLDIYSPQQKEQRAKLQAEIRAIEQKLKTADPASLERQTEWEAHFPREQQWSSLKPLQASAKSGGTIGVGQDDAVQFSPLGKLETYKVRLALDRKQITGLRLSMLPHGDRNNTTPLTEGFTSTFMITRVSANVIAGETNALQARYARVELSGKNKYLSLAEVQLFRGKENLALKGVATQSSTAFDGPANLALDDKTDGNYDNKSTTHTDASDNPWWEVDLKASQAIDRIVIWNRTDNELQQRLNGFRLALLDADRRVVWERTNEAAPNPSTTFNLDGTKVQFSAVFADATQPEADLGGIVEERAAKKGWMVDAKDNEQHYLTLLLPRPLTVPPGALLELTVEQKAQGDRCPPALLRVSASEDSRISEYAGVPLAALEVLATKPAGRTEQQRAALTEYYRGQVDPQLQPERTRLQELNKQTAQIQPNTVPILRETVEGKRRKTQIQLRGNYLALGEEVTEGVPAVFHSLPQNCKPDRLALARWLVDRDNPLTARVIVNRFWEQIFGTGIVRTSEDFGTQGDLPTHPELLDWLATEFVAQKWDVKAFLKLLVTSATYRQSARVTPELQERDPDNLLLARGARFRMPAEVVRDQALAVSGLLSSKMYGAPVRPPRPSLGLAAAFGSSLDWKASDGEDKYRRGIYVEWRRTSPYPSMVTFDAPNREVCALRRPRSNTPLQALVTLNDPVYVEAAQSLARRMSGKAGAIADKIGYGFRLCLAREPRPKELQQLVQFYEKTKTSATSEMAVKLTAASASESSVELAALTAVGNVLLNLDELLMRP